MRIELVDSVARDVAGRLDSGQRLDRAEMWKMYRSNIREVIKSVQDIGPIPDMNTE